MKESITEVAMTTLGVARLSGTGTASGVMAAAYGRPDHDGVKTAASRIRIP
jgi:hypothetical protein